MDIHKPKPWHGLREFLKEYVIIVVGVLTALAAEQTVEWLHGRHQAEQTEARLEAEVKTNLRNAYALLITQRCYDQRLTALATELRGHGAWRGAAIQRTPAPAPESVPPYIRAGILNSASLPVYMAKMAVWPDSSWTSALASGVTLHIGQDRTDRYARLYKAFPTMRDIQAAESDTAAKLSVLSADRELSEAERTHFLEQVGQLSFWNVQLAAFARGMIESAALADIRLSRADVESLIESERHYFLTKDCVERVAIPIAAKD